MQADTCIDDFVQFIYSNKDKKPLQHKGDNGVVLVVGGSLYYTGAPFFVSIAALRGVMPPCFLW